MGISSDTSDSIRATSNRRQIWYFLGTGGALIAILAGFTVWLPWHRQTRAIAEIERLGGKVVLVAAADPDWLRDIIGDEAMVGFDRVENVVIEGISGSDAGVS